MFIILYIHRNLFPDNIVQMAFTQYESKLIPKYKQPKRVILYNESLLYKNDSVYATNLINVILFSNNHSSHNFSNKTSKNGIDYDG